MWPEQVCYLTSAKTRLHRIPFGKIYHVPIGICTRVRGHLGYHCDDSDGTNENAVIFKEAKNEL